MKIINKVVLTSYVKQSNQAILNLDLALDHQELEKAIKDSIKNAEHLFKKIQNNAFLKNFKKHTSYQHNLNILLYKAKFIESFKAPQHLFQPTPFSISLNALYSSETFIEKSFFLFALFLSLGDMKRKYLANKMELSYYLKHQWALNDFIHFFNSLKDNVHNFEYNQTIKQQCTLFFKYTEDIINTISTMNYDNFKKPLFLTNENSPFWMNDINQNYEPLH